MESVFEIKDKDLLGRIGVLHTRSGKIETPAFFPVIHPYRQKYSLSARDISEIGFRTLITNAYLVRKFYGDKAIEEGLKKILGFEGILMTDSGAYQILLYGSVDVSNREIVEYQNKLDQDIAVILDIPTDSEASYDKARESVEETLRRAREVLDVVSSSDKLWVLPIQGGGYTDLIMRSAIEGSEIPGYSVYGIGSPVTYLENYDYEKIFSAIIVAKKYLHPDKPVHLFGAGHPMLIPFIVALGIDLFDSASYILYARDNRYMTEYGTERLEDLEEFPCSCPVCSKYSPKDLMEMSKEERVRLLALHNLYVINREIKRVKTAIREGRLWELITERSFSHPSLRNLMKIFTSESRFIERYTPVSKGRRGVLISDPLSIARPTIIRTRIRGLSTSIDIIRRIKCYKIILIPRDENKKASIELREISDDSCVVYYTPFLGVYISDLIDTYPYSQYELSHQASSDPSIVRELAKDIEMLIESLARSGVARDFTVYVSRDHMWSVEISRLLRDSDTLKVFRELISFKEI